MEPDWRLSNLWNGRRHPFEAFQSLLHRLAITYDCRDGRHDDRIRISVDDINGLPICSTVSLPYTAFDDLVLAVQELTQRHREDNRSTGWHEEHCADGRLFRLDTRGEDRETYQAKARHHYAEAARITAQPDDYVA